MAQLDTVSLNNNEKTLLHTQASDRTPRQKRGGFFCVLIFHWLKTPAAFSAEVSERFQPAPGKRRGFCPVGHVNARWE
jgi:hypothetical protein